MPRTNYEKLKLEVQSIDSNLSDKISKMNSILEILEQDISELMVDVEKSRNSNKELGDKIISLKTEYENKEVEFETKRIELNKKKSGLTANEEKISDLKHRKITLEGDIGNSERIFNQLQSDIARKERALKELKDDLVTAESLYEHKVKVIEDEIEQVKLDTINKENQYKVLKIMLDDDYVRTNYYNVLKVVTQAGVDSLDKLQRASAVGKDEVRETLQVLHTKGVITYDPKSGKYSILKEFVV